MDAGVELGQIWRERHPQRLVKITHIWPDGAVTIRACDENGNFTLGSKYIVRKAFGQAQAEIVWPRKSR
jgi:hypothetical protein